MLDEQFAVPDYDLKDEDYIAGECSECFNYSRYLNVDMLCPKCVNKHESECANCGKRYNESTFINKDFCSLECIHNWNITH